MPANMERAFVLSVSLVAFSGGAGFGLSALHDYSAPTSTVSSTARDDQAEAASEFVIPQHVPFAFKVAAFAPTSHAPEPHRADITLPEPKSQTPATVRPRSRSQAATPVATPQARRVNPSAAPEKTAARSSTHTADRRTKARARAPAGHGLQFFVEDVRAAPRNAPEYIVGVYR